MLSIRTTVGITLMAGCASLFAQTPADGLFRRQPGGTMAAYLPTIARSSHAANLLRRRNGDLLCFWFTGKAEGLADVGIAFSRLPAGSNQWTPPKLIDHDASSSFQNPVGFEASNGTLWLFHTTQAAGQGQSHARILVSRSRDGGRNWGSPQTLFDQPGSFTRQPLIVRPDGAWLLPMYVTPSAGITDNAETNYSLVKLSRDQGRTWTDCPIPQSNGYVQPSVVQLGKSMYLAFFRSRFADHIYRSESSDGCHWSAPAATPLPNNNSSIQAVRLRDGKIAMAFNNTHGTLVNGKPTTGPRVPLSVALSSDGGLTWTPPRDLETIASDELPGPTGIAAPEDKRTAEYSYPAILQQPSGEVVVAYTFRRETIKVVTFPESWLSGQEAQN